MNHPLVRRKFGATFFFSPLESGPGYGDRVVENVVEGSRSLAVHVRHCSFLSLGSLSDIPRFFLPLSLSLSLLLREPDFSFFIYLVLFSFTFLLRLYVFLPLRAVFPDVSLFFLSFVSTATHFSVVLFPSSLAPSFHLAPRSGWELKWIQGRSAISPGRQLLVIPLVSRGRWEPDGAYSP